MKTKHLFFLLPCIGLFIGCNQPKTRIVDESQPEPPTQSEGYQDMTLAAYRADTAFYPQEETLIEKQIGFVASQIQTLNLPEDWKGNDMLEQMVTLYNTMEVLHAIETDYDAYMRYADGDNDFDEEYEDETEEVEDNEDSVEDTDLKQELMTELRSVSLESITDPALRKRILAIIDFIGTGDENSEATDISDIIEDLTSSWFPELPGDSVAYEALIAPAYPNYHLPDNVPNVFDKYVGNEATPTAEETDNILKNAFNEKNFCAKTAWAFVALGLKMAGADYSTPDIDSLLLIETEDMLASGNYSPMLDPLWRAYRIKYNDLHTCPSTWCYSPNLHYNHFRRMIAYTTLRHIEAHPEDDLAKVQYYFLVLHSNIIRLNAYPFGNSSGAEFMDIYWYQALLNY